MQYVNNSSKPNSIPHSIGMKSVGGKKNPPCMLLHRAPALPNLGREF